MGSRNMHSEIVLVANDQTADLVDTLMLRSQSSILGMLSAKSGIDFETSCEFWDQQGAFGQQVMLGATRSFSPYQVGSERNSRGSKQLPRVSLYILFS